MGHLQINHEVIELDWDILRAVRNDGMSGDIAHIDLRHSSDGMPYMQKMIIIEWDDELVECYGFLNGEPVHVKDFPQVLN